MRSWKERNPMTSLRKRKRTLVIMESGRRLMASTRRFLNITEFPPWMATLAFIPRTIRTGSGRWSHRLCRRMRHLRSISTPGEPEHICIPQRKTLLWWRSGIITWRMRVLPLMWMPLRHFPEDICSAGSAFPMQRRKGLHWSEPIRMSHLRIHCMFTGQRLSIRVITGQRFLLQKGIWPMTKMSYMKLRIILRNWPKKRSDRKKIRKQ